MPVVLEEAGRSALGHRPPAHMVAGRPKLVRGSRRGAGVDARAEGVGLDHQPNPLLLGPYGAIVLSPPTRRLARSRPLNQELTECTSRIFPASPPYSRPLTPARRGARCYRCPPPRAQQVISAHQQERQQQRQQHTHKDPGYGSGQHDRYPANGGPPRAGSASPRLATPKARSPSSSAPSLQRSPWAGGSSGREPGSGSGSGSHGSVRGSDRSVSSGALEQEVSEKLKVPCRSYPATMGLSTRRSRDAAR